MSTAFTVTWDYRCPFARNAHEHILTGLEGGADWDVRFLAFALDQAHIDDGQPAAWEEPDRYPGLLVNMAGIVVRDRMPDQFLRVHRALFAARHDQALDTRERTVVAKALADAGVDAEQVLKEVDSGWPLETLATEHQEGVELHNVFGVPTFILDGRAVFVRLMDRPGGDAAKAVATIERVAGLIGDWPELNEFKYTSISR
jgi:hypothetical protein